jgi:hypothetical protein
LADTLALEKLYSDVVARFTTDATFGTTPSAAAAAATANPFGWRQTSRQERPGPRIVWVPGDDRTGNVGEIAPPRYPGRNPRPLGTLVELFTVYITSQDPTAPENEAAQYKATRLLFDAWYRAVYLAAHGTYTIDSVEWEIEKTQRRWGAAIRVVGSVQAMIPDAAREFVSGAILGARIGVSELDVTETIEIPPDPYADPYV